MLLCTFVLESILHRNKQSSSKFGLGAGNSVSFNELGSLSHPWHSLERVNFRGRFFNVRSAASLFLLALLHWLPSWLLNELAAGKKLMGFYIFESHVTGVDDIFWICLNFWICVGLVPNMFKPCSKVVLTV